MQELDSIVSDILVIGAGGCGLMAALVAAKKGARVMLLEKTDKPGGGTAFSSRGIRAAGSRRQRELNIVDSAELYAQDILRRNNNESDEVRPGGSRKLPGAWPIFSPTWRGSNFSSVSLPLVTGRSARTHGRRIRPSPIFSSKQSSGRKISRCDSRRRYCRSNRNPAAR